MTSDAGPPGAPRFNLVLRGYDRRQVDEHIARLQRVIARMRAELDGRQQAAFPPRGPMPHPGGPPGMPPGMGSPDAIGGFTDRMQRILQAAEEEAEEIRNRARAAARAESEQLRAQLGELARQRDAILHELGQLRGGAPGDCDLKTLCLKSPDVTKNYIYFKRILRIKFYAEFFFFFF